MWNVILRNAAKATILFLFTSIVSLLHAQFPTVGYRPLINAGLSEPMEVVTAPGDATGRLFIVEKAGTIRIWNGTAVLSTPFLNISSLVRNTGEQGLLSMAFHPQYQVNGFFFVYYNSSANGNIIVSRYQVSADPNIALPTANPTVPWVSIPKPFDNHNGGHLQFKSEAGVHYLYFATGDGGSGDDPNRNSQNPAVRLGKMLRMNVDDPTPTTELWAWGLRNPFRWSFDHTTGDMWIGDVGQGLREEVSFRAGGTGGANYGWPCFEGTLTNGAGQSGSRCDTVDPVDVLPIFEYNNPTPGSSSIVGGYVYRGTQYPALAGHYITVDFYSGQLWLIRSNGAGGWTISAPQPGLPTNISSISESNDGSALYAVSLTGNRVYQVVDAVITPVSLIRFFGTPTISGNEIKWITASETNVSKFIVEYSRNGRDFQYAGEVVSLYPSGGNYSFLHAGRSNEKLFYRLKTIDADGRFEFSAIIELGNGTDRTFRVYPTVIENGTVNIISSLPIAQLELYNMDGRVLLSRNINGQSGFFTQSLPALPKGVYYLHLSGKDFRTTEKIVVR